jgi:hypothetical protein
MLIWTLSIDRWGKPINTNTKWIKSVELFYKEDEKSIYPV